MRKIKNNEKLSRLDLHVTTKKYRENYVKDKKLVRLFTSFLFYRIKAKYIYLVKINNFIFYIGLGTLIIALKNH